jgi:hypothetical protein
VRFGTGFLAAAVLIAGGFFSSTEPAQNGPVAADSYWATLDEIRTTLQTDPEPAAETLEVLAGRLEAITGVALETGVVLPVDHRFLAGFLRSDPPQTERLLGILDQAFNQRNGSVSARFGEGELNALAAILSGPEYRWPEPAPPNPLVELWQRILNGFARLLARLVPGAGAGAVINTVLLIGIAVVLGLILRYIYVNSIRGVIREAEIDPATGVPPGLTAEAAIDRARRRAEAGDRREAVRYLYLAALLALEERGHIRLDRAHTNRELLADLSARPELASRFRTVIEVFDRVWYGFQPISQEEFARYTQSVTEIGK